jgi:hypothetical protein
MSLLLYHESRRKRVPRTGIIDERFWRPRYVRH